MSAPILGRVLDPEALAAGSGARGRVQVEVPSTWLDEPCSIELAVPSRLVCARCDGGGCDGCGRSGAVQLRGEQAARMVCVVIPSAAPPLIASRLAIRIAEPFGPEGGLALLIVEVRAGAMPSRGITRRAPALARRRAPRRMTGLLLLGLAAAAILIAICAR